MPFGRVSLESELGCVDFFVVHSYGTSNSLGLPDVVLPGPVREVEIYHQVTL